MNFHGHRTSRNVLTAFIVCTVLLCFVPIGMATAKYVSQIIGTDTVTAALFTPSLISDNNIDISGIKKPGDSTEQTFTVTNGTDGKISEVSMKYKIIVKTTGNIPLTFTLLDGEETVLEKWDCDGISGRQEYKYECPRVFSPGVDETHSYKIKVDWQASQNQAQFAGMTDAVYLSVIWEQVD